MLEDPELKLSGSFRFLLAQLHVDFDQLTGRIAQTDAVIQQRAREDEACQRLTTIPGVGPMTATALIAAIGDGTAFREGRELAAWIGMVPQGRSSGGRSDFSDQLTANVAIVLAAAFPAASTESTR